jgi:alpha-beta hydrolase superfamily lysophospholipase
MSDGEEIYLRLWEVENPKGLVQVVHGMAEHAGRYDRFAQALNQAGYGVVASDHRGHGQTGLRGESLGDFPESGWNRVVEDLSEVRSFAENHWTGKPVFLIGHSMGSFLTRSLIAREGDRFAGAILSGTAGDPGLAGAMGLGLASLQMPWSASRPNPLMDRLSFGSYNRSFQPNRTAFDWLSRDEREVDAYVEDPLCGFVCTTRFYRELLTGLIAVNEPPAFERVPKALPICLMAGGEDPVGNFGKGVVEVSDKFKAAKSDVSLHLFPQARHEILNEVNRQEVMEAMIGWMNNVDQKK